MALNLLRSGLSSVKLSQLARFSHHAAHKFGHTPSADLTELDNGIRIATEKTNSSTATIGVYVEGGSRHETEELNGITNFLQQLIFKGSQKRSKQQLEKDVYELGAILNSYTSPENSAIFATLSPADVPKGLDLLADLIQNPGLSDENIEEARKEILNEVEECESNNFEQVVMDNLHRVAYQDTTLAFSKYGPTANIQRFTKDDIEQGIDLMFKGPRLVIAASGNVDHDKVVKQAEKAFSGITVNYTKNSVPDHPEGKFTGSDIRVRDDSMNCAHVAFSVQGPSYNSPDFVTMQVATALLGNWDLTQGGTRTETARWIQSFQNFNLPYSDTGLIGTYFVGERMYLEDFLVTVMNYYKSLCAEATNNELRAGKNNLLTKLINQRDGSVRNANSIATDIFRFGRRMPLEEWASQIEQVNSGKMHRVASEYIWDRCPAISAIGPVEALPLYEDVRMRMSFWRF